MKVDFEPNEVKFDREELKVLASDTRVEILKNLKERNYTVSELSKKLGHSKSTMHEHLSKLVEAELIEKADNYTDKWIYYRLSRRGKGLFADSTKRVVVIISSILLVVGVMQIAVFFTSLPLMAPQPQQMYIASGLEGDEVLTGPEAEAPPPGAVSKEHAIEPPKPEEEQRVATREEVIEQRAREGFVPEPGAGAIKEIPYFFIGGIGFISAAFILAHYYKTKPSKLFLEKKRK